MHNRNPLIRNISLQSLKDPADFQTSVDNNYDTSNDLFLMYGDTTTQGEHPQSNPSNICAKMPTTKHIEYDMQQTAAGIIAAR
jgi:hypothetical protein